VNFINMDCTDKPYEQICIYDSETSTPFLTSDNSMPSALTGSTQVTERNPYAHKYKKS
jgi:hypothetical protein